MTISQSSDVELLKAVVKSELAEIIRGSAVTAQVSADNHSSIADLRSDIQYIKDQITNLKIDNAKAAVRWGVVSVLSSIIMAASINFAVSSAFNLEPDRDSTIFSMLAIPPKNDPIRPDELKIERYI